MTIFQLRENDNVHDKDCTILGLDLDLVNDSALVRCTCKCEQWERRKRQTEWQWKNGTPLTREAQEQMEKELDKIYMPPCSSHNHPLGG